MSAERREKRQRAKGGAVMLVGIVLPPLVLALARACPGPPVQREAGDEVDEKMWALLPVNFTPRIARCGFLFVFPEDHFSPQPSITLYGLLDGSCVDRRDFLCKVKETGNQTANTTANPT